MLNLREKAFQKFYDDLVRHFPLRYQKRVAKVQLYFQPRTLKFYNCLLEVILRRLVRILDEGHCEDFANNSFEELELSIGHLSAFNWVEKSIPAIGN